MNNIKFEATEIKKISFEDYDDKEFAIAKVCILSTRPNSHGLIISENVLRECAKTMLGKWLVCDISPMTGDATTHTVDEVICGVAPKDQEVEFVEEDGYLHAYVTFVISKIYADKLCELFDEEDNHRPTSIEMTVVTEHDKPIDDTVLSFNAVGITVLGRSVSPSCKDADIEFVRFSAEKAEEYYEKVNEASNKLKQFADKRRVEMAQKVYKINKTELKDTEWGDIDKTELRDKVMDAKNRNTLVKSVYAIVEDGWQDAPSEHLKYPLMEESDGTFYYNRYALASALAYARQNNEQEVIDKVEKLYEKFDIDDSDKKENEEKMSEQEVIEEVEEKEDDVLEELAEPEAVEEQPVEEGSEEQNIQEEVEEEKEEPHDEMAEKLVQLQGEYDNIKAQLEQMQDELNLKNTAIEEKDHIIMERDEELKELRKFRDDTNENIKMMKVSEVLAIIKDRVPIEKYAEFEISGKQIKLNEFDAWKNGVMACVGENAVQFSEVQQNSSHMRMGVFVNEKRTGSVWDRL